MKHEIISFRCVTAHVSVKSRRDLSCRSLGSRGRIRDIYRFSALFHLPFFAFFFLLLLLIISCRTVVIPSERLDPSQCNLLSRAQRVALSSRYWRREQQRQRQRQNIERGWLGPRIRRSKGKNGGRRMQKRAKRR